MTRLTRHWAIVIGINQYQFRQPLLCAQPDAENLYNWMTGQAGQAGQAGLMPQHCLLSTDSSPLWQGRSTSPTAANLQLWVDGLGQMGIAEGDRLWVFFSGYGECWEGEDYLLPIDAAAPSTSVSIKTLFSRLKTLPTQDILLLLDINRSQSARTRDRLGHQTLTLAKEMGIATILSCQPEQFSHESSALGQGFFTASLLEGLRVHAGQPLGVLVKFMQRRLPELSEHNYRPRQDPIAVISPLMLEQWQLPSLQTQTVLQPSSTVIPRPATMLQTKIQADVMPEPAVITLDEVSPIERQPIEKQPIDNLARSRHTPGMFRDELNSKQVLWRVLVLGGLIFLLLNVANLLRNPVTKPQNTENPTAPRSATTTNSPIPTVAQPDPAPRLEVPKSPPADSSRILEDARALIQPTSASQLNQAIERATQIPPGDGRYAETQRQIERWCGDILTLANQRADRGQFKEAIAAAKLVPTLPTCSSTTANAAKAIGAWQQKRG
jgi:Caspase domain